MSTGLHRLWLTTSSGGRSTMPYKPAGSLDSLLLGVRWQRLDNLQVDRFRMPRLQQSAPLAASHTEAVLMLGIQLPSATWPGAAPQVLTRMVEYLHSAVSQVKHLVCLLITLICLAFSHLPGGRLVIPPPMQAWRLWGVFVVHPQVRRLTLRLYWGLGRLPVNLQGLLTALFQWPILDRLQANRLARLMQLETSQAPVRSLRAHSGALLTLGMELQSAIWPDAALRVLNHMVFWLQMVIWQVRRLAYLLIMQVYLQLLKTRSMEDPTASLWPLPCYPQVAGLLADQPVFLIALHLAVIE